MNIKRTADRELSRTIKEVSKRKQLDKRNWHGNGDHKNEDLDKEIAQARKAHQSIISSGKSAFELKSNQLLKSKKEYLKEYKDKNPEKKDVI